MGFLTMKTLNNVWGEMRDNFAHIALHCEIVSVEASCGRVAAEDIYAREEAPAFDRSCVDGYAIISRDTFGASESVPCFLKKLSAAQMGEATYVDIKSGEAVYVPTGAQIPAQADAVVMIEYCEELSSDMVAVNHAVAPSTNIMYKGDDCRQGSLLITRGTRITPIHIGIMVAAGIAELSAYMLPSCAIVSTGDELVDIGKPLPPGCIRDVNAHMIGAELEAYGCNVVYKVIVRDSFDEIRSAIQDSLAQADVVVISGGTSVGEKDYTFQAIESIEDGSVFVHGLAVKPGKPTILAKIGGKPVFGLPGQSVSAYVIYKAIVQYYMDMLCGSPAGIGTSPHLVAALTTNVHSAPGKLTFQAVRLSHDKGMFFAEPLYGKSGLVSYLMSSGGLIVIDEKSEGLYAGEMVDVVRL